MSTRCRGCDAPLSRGESTIINKFSKLEEDLCVVCRYMSRHAPTAREYIGGANPVTGVTQPAKGEV